MHGQAVVLHSFFLYVGVTDLIEVPLPTQEDQLSLLSATSV